MTSSKDSSSKMSHTVLSQVCAQAKDMVLGAFVKLLQATISFVVPACLFAWKKNSAPTGRILTKFDI